MSNSNNYYSHSKSNSSWKNATYMELDDEEFENFFNDEDEEDDFDDDKKHKNKDNNDSGEYKSVIRRLILSSALAITCIVVSGLAIKEGFDYSAKLGKLLSEYSNADITTSENSYQKIAYREMISFLRGNWNKATLFSEKGDMYHIAQYIIETREENLGLDENSTLYNNVNPTWKEIQVIYDEFPEVQQYSRIPNNVAMLLWRNAFKTAQFDKANLLAILKEYVIEHREQNVDKWDYQNNLLCEESEIDRSEPTKQELLDAYNSLDDITKKYVRDLDTYIESEYSGEER